VAVIAPLRVRMSRAADGREGGTEGRERARDVIIFQILSVPFLPLSGENFYSYTLPTDTNLLPPSHISSDPFPLFFFFLKKKKDNRNYHLWSSARVLFTLHTSLSPAKICCQKAIGGSPNAMHTGIVLKKVLSSNDRTSHRDVKSK